MKKSKIPTTDSIQKLAEFWDTHDLTDFDDELVEVTEPVFERTTPILLNLQPSEADAIHKMAQRAGLSREELVHKWVVAKLSQRSGRQSTKTRRPAICLKVHRDLRAI
jgi:hypothetical protein